MGAFVLKGDVACSADRVSMASIDLEDIAIKGTYKG
jgi:hypothetical protein